jgi:hypothetical protein
LDVCHLLSVLRIDIRNALTEADKLTQVSRHVGLRVDDVLASRLDRKFDLVIDRCCLHVLPATRYAEYVHAIASLLVPERNAPPQVFRRRSAGIIRAEPLLSQRYSETLRSRVRYPSLLSQKYVN